jgi:hypothetical protein
VPLAQKQQDSGNAGTLPFLCDGVKEKRGTVCQSRAIAVCSLSYTSCSALAAEAIERKLSTQSQRASSQQPFCRPTLALGTLLRDSTFQNHSFRELAPDHWFFAKTTLSYDR